MYVHFPCVCIGIVHASYASQCENEVSYIILYVPGGTSITCDQGWGCTLRCGQMVMGNTLLFKHLGRGESHDHHMTVT